MFSSCFLGFEYNLVTDLCIVIIALAMVKCAAVILSDKVRGSNPKGGAAAATTMRQSGGMGWWPIFGHIFSFGENPHRTLMAASMRYINRFLYLKFGSWNTVVVNGSREIRRLFGSRHGQGVIGRPPFVDYKFYSGGHSLSFQPDQKIWQMQRKAAAKALGHLTNVGFVEKIILRQAEILLAKWSNDKSASSFDPSTDVTTTVATILYSMCYGRGKRLDANEAYSRLLLGSNPATDFFAIGQNVDVLPPCLRWMRAGSHKEHVRRMGQIVDVNDAMVRKIVDSCGVDAIGKTGDGIEEDFGGCVNFTEIKNNEKQCEDFDNCDNGNMVLLLKNELERCMQKNPEYFKKVSTEKYGKYSPAEPKDTDHDTREYASEVQRCQGRDSIRLTPEDFLNLPGEIMSAGSETSTATILWILALVASDKSVQCRIHEEIRLFYENLEGSDTSKEYSKDSVNIKIDESRKDVFNEEKRFFYENLKGSDTTKVSLKDSQNLVIGTLCKDMDKKKRMTSNKDVEKVQQVHHDDKILDDDSKLYNATEFSKTCPENTSQHPSDASANLDKPRLIRYSDKEYFPFTESCILESMRYASVVPFGLPHYSTKRVKIDDEIVIDPNCLVYANLWSAGHDPEIWQDPEVYDPSRFLMRRDRGEIGGEDRDAIDQQEVDPDQEKFYEDKINRNDEDLLNSKSTTEHYEPKDLETIREEEYKDSKIKRSAELKKPIYCIDKSKLDLYFPFGLGRRRCVGEQVGKIITFVVSVNILSKFRIELVNQEFQNTTEWLDDQVSKQTTEIEEPKHKEFLQKEWNILDNNKLYRELANKKFHNRYKKEFDKIINKINPCYTHQISVDQKLKEEKEIPIIKEKFGDVMRPTPYKIKLYYKQ